MAGHRSRHRDDPQRDLRCPPETVIGRTEAMNELPLRSGTPVNGCPAWPSRPNPMTSDHDQRPWGDYTVLDEATDYKVKRITVLPGKRLSYQRHARRQEHWLVVRGAGRVTLEGREFDVLPGTAVDVPIGAAHRIAQPRHGSAPRIHRSATRRLLRRGRHRPPRRRFRPNRPEALTSAHRRPERPTAPAGMSRYDSEWSLRRGWATVSVEGIGSAIALAGRCWPCAVSTSV